LSRLQFKSKSRDIWVTIPYQEDILKIIEVAHGVYEGTVIKHNGIKVTKKKILSFGLNWNRLEQDIIQFIKRCKQCINQSSERPCNVPKVIEPTWPLNRIVADNWTIPKRFQEELGSNQNYKYVLTCVDHFSKYKWCFLLPNKEPKTILDRLEIVFSTFSKPDIFQSDNGLEFKNPLIKNYCEKNRIQFINGRVRHPQSQGVVEKINEFIAQSLKSSFEDYFKKKLDQEDAKRKNYWEIETALMMFVANQNNKPHTVTNFAPVDLISYRNRENPEHLKVVNKVKERIYSYYAPQESKEVEDRKKKKTINKRKLPILKLNMKVFIIGQVKKGEKNKSIVEDISNKKTKIEMKLHKYKVPALVINVSCLKNNHIKVRIVGKPQHKSLKINEAYDVHLKHIEIANPNSWQALLDD